MVYIMNTNIISVAKCFGCNHPLWQNDKTHNLYVVRVTLDRLYNEFRRRGYLFLYEAYQELDIDITKQSLSAGWIYDKKYTKQTMWGYFTKNDGYDDVYITFEPMVDISDVLPDE